jgi:hypothetical protein
MQVKLQFFCQASQLYHKFQGVNQVVQKTTGYEVTCYWPAVYNREWQ